MRKNVIRSIVIYTFALLCVLPLVIMIFYSMRDTQGTFTFQQYIQALLFSGDFIRGYWNALMYTGLIILFNVPLSLLCAYGFSRFKFKGNRVLFWLYIVLMLMPFQATIVPQYLTLSAFHLINHPMAVILPNIFATFGTVLMAQYMRGLGKELFDAGKIDGFSDFHLFIRIVTPMCKTLISALMVLSFINYWSMIEQPLVFISDTADMPLAVTLNASTQFRTISFAIGVIFSVLPLLLYQFSYQDLVYGISTVGGVTNVQNSNVNTNIQSSNRKKKLRLIIGFMIFMCCATLANQKISEITLTTVEVQRPESKDIKSDFFDPNSPSLGYYSYVLPKSSIFSDGVDQIVYIIEQERSMLARTQLVKIRAPISKENGVEVAVSGAISKEYSVVVKSDYPLPLSRFVKVYDPENSVKHDDAFKEKVLYVVPESDPHFIEDLDNRPEGLPYVVSTSQEAGRVIVSVENQESLYDPFLADRFLESANMHFWIDSPMVEVQDFTHFGAVVNEFKRLVIFFMLVFGFSLLVYILYQFIKTQVTWLIVQLKTQYMGEITKIHLSWIFEQVLAMGILIGIMIITYINMVAFKFVITAQDVLKYHLLKWDMVKSATEGASQTLYGNECFTLLANTRLKALGLIFLLLFVFVIAVIGIRKYYIRKRLSYGKSDVSQY